MKGKYVSAFDSFFEPQPKKPSSNALLNQCNESQEQSQSAMCSSSTSFDTCNIVSTSFNDIGSVSN